MKTTLSVKGMHCKSCEMLLADSLGDIKGVKAVKADHKKGKVEVEHEEHVSVQDIKKLIKKGGYEA